MLSQAGPTTQKGRAPESPDRTHAANLKNKSSAGTVRLMRLEERWGGREAASGKARPTTQKGLAPGSPGRTHIANRLRARLHAPQCDTEQLSSASRSAFADGPNDTKRTRAGKPGPHPRRHPPARNTACAPIWSRGIGKSLNHHRKTHVERLHCSAQRLPNAPGQASLSRLQKRKGHKAQPA